MNAPADLPAWSLADLYSGPDDPGIARDLERAAALARELAGHEGRFLAARADPRRLAGADRRGAQALRGPHQRAWAAWRPTPRSPPRPRATIRPGPSSRPTCAAARPQIAAESLFFTLELNELEDAEIEAALEADPAAARWRPWLRRVRLSRPHELSADLERLLRRPRARRSANWARLYDETLARLKIARRARDA